MGRHATSRLKALDAAFPVRLKIRIPNGGLGRAYVGMFEWLDREVGRDRYADTGAPSLGGEVMALHFVTTEEATAFLIAHPDLVLADERSRLSLYDRPTTEPSVDRGRIE